ncbi:MAG: hypothetical protein NTW59_00155 [Candidatus Diapherotrites archaeon]|nr:hypothetical protein [Candidatus Diapherotrites archaeon]
MNKSAFLLAAFLLLLLQSCAAQTISEQPVASKSVTLYLFWGNGCPHCAKEEAFLGQMKVKYPTLEVKDLEMWYHPENQAVYDRFSTAFGTSASGVPMTFVGNMAFNGFAEEEGSLVFLADQNVFIGYRNQIEARIAKCATAGCPSADDVLSGTAEPAIGNSGETIELPFLGKIDPKTVSLPLLTVVIGLIDGFNACAMFVLLVLLGILIRIGSRKRMALVAGAFVFFSGLVYFLFMTVWLNLFEFIGSVGTVFTIVGIIAVVVGAINIKDFFFFKKGPSLSIPEKAKPKLFDRMRALVQHESLHIMLAAAIVLAITVNFVEFLCTFGLPMVYTKILAEQEIPALMKYAYLALYQVFYMLDDTIMVTIAVITLSSKKMTERYGRLLKLICGAIMLVLGLVLLFNPGILVFG